MNPNEIWDFVDRIKEYQNPVKIPKNVQDELDAILKPENADDLRKGVSVSYPHTFQPWENKEKKEHAVHITKILIGVPYDQFIKEFPPEEWGMNLANLAKIGKVADVVRDDDCRVVKQIERMEFGSFLGLADLDMTKTEIIEYEDDLATVYWRVYFSDNKTTDEDLGKVEFRKYGMNETLVTFHSAHRFIIGGIEISTGRVLKSLREAFIEHVQKYKGMFTERDALLSK